MFDGELPHERVGAHKDSDAERNSVRRVEDGEAPGRILLTGVFYCQHRDEILSLVREVERRERGVHPHDKILSLQDTGRNVIITTTGTNLPRRIASALSYAFQGQVTFKYDRDLDRLRVTWSR